MEKVFGHYTACFILGILTATYLPLPRGLLISGLILSTALVLFNKFFSWRKTSVYILLAFVFLGALRQHYALDRLATADRYLVNKNIEVCGMICEEPVVRENTTDYIFKINELKGGNKDTEKISAKILVRLRNTPVPATAAKSRKIRRYGEILCVRGVLESPPPPSNPGQFDYRSYCRQQGISGIMYPEKVTTVGMGRKTVAGVVTGGAIKIKEKLRDIALRSLPQQDYYVVDGLLFGGAGNLDGDFKTDLQKTGVIHVLSVSGFHVGLVMAGTQVLLRCLRIRKKRVHILVALAVLFLYTLMTGWRPSVLRAAVMACLPLVGSVLGRKSSWPVSLSAACMLLLMWNPANLFTTGAQLSFAATWGILYLTSPIKNLIGFMPAALRGSLAVIFAAQISTMPLLIYYFNYLPLFSVLANLLVVPLITLIILLACTSLTVGLLFLPGAVLLNTGTSCLLQVVRWIIWIVGRLPVAVYNIQSPRLWELVIWYGILVLLGALYWERLLYLRVLWIYKRNRRSAVTLALFLMCIFVWFGVILPAKRLNVTFLDVGEADCAVVIGPRRYVLVIDTGGSLGLKKSFDPGRTVLAPYLRSMGVQQVDLLVLSHFHRDHIGGIAGLAGEFTIKQVLVPGEWEDSEEVRQVFALLKRKHIPIINAGRLKQIVLEPGLQLRILGPPRKNFENTVSDVNNNSLVLKLTYGQVTYLFPGDIQQEAIDYYCSEAAEAEGTLKATVLKVPHHGSKGSFDSRFYDKTRPHIAVVSVGPNYFGHPDRRVIEELKQRGAMVYRTDRTGAVTCLSDGKSIRVSAFRKEGMD
ncbi:DNA internalization-related competence protein ComEC/Rec2 [Thermincola ferriacetica]